MKTFREYVNEAVNLKSVYAKVDMSKGDVVINGTNWRDFKKTEDVQKGTTFFAVNSNGKKQSKKLMVNARASRITINGNDYYVIFNLSFPGKELGAEPMFAEVKKD